MMDEVKLYRKNSVGIGTWRIWPDHTVGRLYYAHATTQGSSEVVHYDDIELNMSGRTIVEQMKLEFESRINRMKNKGYKTTIEEAQAGPTNQLGLLMPMLAHPVTRVGWPSFAQDAYVQPKFDGHRCLITNCDGEMVAYTRLGKPITTVDHILQQFSWLSPGKTVDGELYIHGDSLQNIGSYIKRLQPKSAELKYHWYDYMSERHFGARYAAMRMAHAAQVMPSVELVETVKVSSRQEVMAYFTAHRGQGYEGTMLRLDGGGYAAGKRSSLLLKVKEREDCEVTVLRCTPSREGWAVLTCLTDWGVEFDTSAPGSHEQKTEVLHNFEKYKGRRLTIEYAMLTADKKPFHAVAIRWRDDV